VVTDPVVDHLAAFLAEPVAPPARPALAGLERLLRKVQSRRQELVAQSVA
jgi:hypothetical protein